MQGCQRPLTHQVTLISSIVSHLCDLYLMATNTRCTATLVLHQKLKTPTKRTTLIGILGVRLPTTTMTGAILAQQMTTHGTQELVAVTRMDRQTTIRRSHRLSNSNSRVEALIQLSHDKIRRQRALEALLGRESGTCLTTIFLLRLHLRLRHHQIINSLTKWCSNSSQHLMNGEVRVRRMPAVIVGAIRTKTTLVVVLVFMVTGRVIRRWVYPTTTVVKDFSSAVKSL